MSLSASPKSANQVQNRLRELFKTIKQLEDARKSSENTLQTITNCHRRVQSDEKLTSVNKNKLIGLCDDAVKDAEKEEPEIATKQPHQEPKPEIATKQQPQEPRARNSHQTTTPRQTKSK